MDEAVPHTFGALAEFFTNYKRENLVDLNIHSVYLVGDEYHTDSKTGQYWGVLSTNNLLLNAYYQDAWSLVTALYIDTSYRYTWQGSGLMTIMTATPTQSGKHIAYAFTSTESSECIESVLRCVKAGIEDAVARLITPNLIPVQNLTGVDGKYYACVD